MALRLRMILAGIAIAFVLTLVAVCVGAPRHQSALSAQIDRLRRTATVQAAAQSVTPQLDNLPAPVARYLRLALPTTKHIEEVLIMGAAFLFAGLALSTENRLVRTVRIIFFVGFASVTTACVALSAMYGFDVEYRFEVAAITIDWTVLIVTATLLAIAYRTQSRGSSQ